MIINIQIDTENSKTLTDAVEFIKKLTDKPQKSETTPEFESVADDFALWPRTALKTKRKSS